MSQEHIPAVPGAEFGVDDAVQVRELDDVEDGGDWITRLLGSGLFRHISPEDSHRFFAELEPVWLRAGEVVIAQGAAVDSLYVVTQGRCAVTRRAPSAQRELQLDVLREGDTFGEDALVSGTLQPTTVRMLGDGVVMRLAAESFERLVRAPTLQSVSHEQACRLVDQGGVWLDVRPHDECASPAIEGSVRAPSHLLALEASTLDRDRAYVAYCERGTHSASSAFLLTRLGFDAYVLDGGLEGARARGASSPDAGAAPRPREVQAPGTPAGRGARRVAGVDPGAILDRIHALSSGLSAALAAAEDAKDIARGERRRNAALMRLIGAHRTRLHTLEHALALAQARAGATGRRTGVDRLRLGRRIRNSRERLRAERDESAALKAALEERCAGLEAERGELARACAESERARADSEREALELRRGRAGLEQTCLELGQRGEGMSADLALAREMLERSAASLRDARDEHRGARAQSDRDRAAVEKAVAERDDAVAARQQAEAAEQQAESARRRAEEGRVHARAELAAAVEALREHVAMIAALRREFGDFTALR